jgi:FMN phosphatase YigB (HAD superfamily)
VPRLDTILFDMGGTLDGRGGWRERCLRLFAEVGLNRFSRDQHMAAFDYADAQSHRAGEMADARLRDMLRCHFGWQLEVLQVDDADVARELVDRFATGAEQAAVVNRRVLETLKERGYRLGLVSNACGNVAALCDEFGYSPSLSAVVDSHWFGRSKPEPGDFFARAPTARRVRRADGIRRRLARSRHPSRPATGHDDLLDRRSRNRGKRRRRRRARERRRPSRLSAAVTIDVCPYLSFTDRCAVQPVAM